MTNRNRRRNYLINPKFQLSFIAYNVAIAGVVSLIFYAAVRFFFWKLLQLGHNVGLSEDHVFFVFIDEQIATINVIFAVTALISTLVLFFHGLYLSHKIAGPLYRLHRHMKEVSTSNSNGPVKFRKGDYFQELEHAYNEQHKTLTQKDSSTEEKKAA